ncbi:hypothetical protein M569_09272, partial [Genlisea aurea]
EIGTLVPSSSLQMICAILAMEPIDAVICFARDFGGGSITENVQSFILENCIRTADTQFQGAYLKRLLKKLISEIEYCGGVVLDELYEQYASHMIGLNDWDHCSNGNSKVLKKISFIYPGSSCLDSCGYISSCFGFKKFNVQLMCSTNMLEGDTGCCIWPSSLFMSEFILSHPEIFASKCCFELGSGVGLVGVCLSHVKASKVILSDGDLQTLANMKCNLELNDVKHVHYLHLPWEEESTSENHLRLHGLKPDVILGADIIYDPLCVPHLVKLLAAVLNRDGHWPGRNPVAYVASVIRNVETFDCFVSVAERSGGLSIEDITGKNRVLNFLPYLRSYQRCAVRMMKICYKS